MNPSEVTAKAPERLANFYQGKRIFITGATGFVGKVTLIKLLSHLSDIEQVYIVMRPKKGLSPQERFKSMLQEAPFKSKFPEQVTNSKQEVDPSMETPGEMCQRLSEEARQDMARLDWSKVRVLEGDMSKDQLGLSDESKQELWHRVDIIFNIAASVDFTAPLKDNLRDNYMGIRI